MQAISRLGSDTRSNQKPSYGMSFSNLAVRETAVKSGTKSSVKINVRNNTLNSDLNSQIDDKENEYMIIKDDQ